MVYTLKPSGCLMDLSVSFLFTHALTAVRAYIQYKHAHTKAGLEKYTKGINAKL